MSIENLKRTLNCCNGNSYHGYFINDTRIREGCGVMKFASTGNEYSGEYKNNKLHGKGIFSYAGKGQYDGEFKDGIQSGKGICTLENGDNFEGEYENGFQKSGIAKTSTEIFNGIFDKKGEKFYGTLQNLKDDQIYSGFFYNDKYEGNGKLIHEGKESTGIFKNGLKNGYFRIKENKEIDKFCFYENDILISSELYNCSDIDDIDKVKSISNNIISKENYTKTLKTLEIDLDLEKTKNYNLNMSLKEKETINTINLSKKDKQIEKLKSDLLLKDKKFNEKIMNLEKINEMNKDIESIPIGCISKVGLTKRIKNEVINICTICRNPEKSAVFICISCRCPIFCNECYLDRSKEKNRPTRDLVKLSKFKKRKRENEQLINVSIEDTINHVSSNGKCTLVINIIFYYLTFVLLINLSN
jgi:hypothetical protein